MFTGNVVSAYPKLPRQVIANTDGHILRIFPRDIHRAQTKAPRGFGNPSPLQRTRTHKKNPTNSNGQILIKFHSKVAFTMFFF